MAGSVGTIFAEIDLDSSRYLKSQQKLLQDATSTSLSIEANFRNLGVKSSAEFDLMRQKITNSYEMIKNSSQATANDIVRAEQAKNNQLNSINEQQFGKQTSLMDKIKTNWFSIATTATAAYATITQFAGPAIKAYMDQENAIVKMGMAMKNQGDFSAAALKEMEDYSEQLQDTTTYADELTLSVMANLKSYGMTNDEVKKATRVAQDFTSAKKQEGMTITTASDLLGKAYVGNTGALSRYGVVIDQTLQGSEKFEAVMGQLEQRFGGSAQAELLTYSGQWEHLKNQWGDIQELLGFGLLKSIEALQVGAGLLATTFLSAGEIILSVFDFIITPITFILEQFAALADYAGMEDLAFGLRSVAKATSEAKDSVTATKEEVMGWTSKQYDALIATDSTTKAIEKMGIQGQKTGAIDKEAAAAAEKAAKDRERATNELTKAIAKSQDEIDSRYMTSHEKELARIEREAEEWLKKTQDDVLVAEWKSTQITIANQKQEDETFKMWRKASEDAEAAMKAEAEAGVKLTEENIKRADERRKAETELYKDLRGYETENYNASLAMIKQKEIDLMALGVNEIAISAWVTEETRKAELKKAEYSNSFFDGVKAGLEDITAKQTSWGKVGIDTVKSFSDNASRTMGSVFFDAYKGQLKSSTEYFTAFTDAIMKSFADALAKMIVEAALSKITMFFNATWTEGAGAVLGAVGNVLGYAADWYFESMVPNAAYGGLIGGLNPGADSYANDTVPAMLSPGEYVMPRSSVNQETVGALEYMRQTGQKPMGYADGGLVASPEEQNAFALYLEGQRSGQPVSYLELLNHGVADQWWLGDNSGGNYFYVSPDMIASLEQGRSRQLAVFEQLMTEYELLQVDLPTFLHNANSDPSYLYKTTVDTWKKFAGLSVLGNPISSTLESPDSMPIVLGYQNNIPVYSGYPWGHLGDYYIVDNSGNLTYGYGSSGKEKFGLNDFIGTATMAVGAAAATYVGGVLGAAIGAELLGSGAVIGGITGAEIGGMVGGAIGSGTLNAAQQSAGGEEFNWTSLGLSSVGGALAGASIGGSDLFTAGSQAAADAAIGDIIEDVAINAVVGAGKKYAINALLGMILDKPESGTLGISFNGISGGEGLAASIKNFPGSVGGSFAFPAKNGLDYVPRDNFMIRAHEGEAVITKEENKRRRDGKTGGNVLQFYFPKALVVDKRSVNELAELIYPRLNKLVAWGT